MRGSIVHRCMHLHALDGPIFLGYRVPEDAAALVRLLPPGRATAWHQRRRNTTEARTPHVNQGRAGFTRSVLTR